MQNQNTHYIRNTTSLFVVLLLACFGLASTAHADSRPSIVGLWSVHYVSTTGGPEALTYDQWHADGLEFEVANLAPGTMCQGTFKQSRNGTVHNYHVAWTFDANGVYSGYWDENLTATVSSDGQSYSGTYSRFFYDTAGNFLFEDDGTLTATRLTVDRD